MPVTTFYQYLRGGTCDSLLGLVGYGPCVINFSYSFSWIFLKLYILVVNIMKMCMRIFNGTKLNFDGITAF